MASGETLAVKKLTLRNKLRNSSIFSARVFKKAQVVFSAISLPRKDFLGWASANYALYCMASRAVARTKRSCN